MEKESSGQGKGKGLSRRAFLEKSASAIGVAAAGISFPFVKTHAASKQPVRIGGLFSMTGSAYATGIGADKSARAAIKRINQMGGISGHPVEYVMEDSATNVQVSIRKMRKMVMQDNCDFVVGPCNSAIDIACASIAKELKTVYFAWGTALSLTGDKGNRYIFRGINNFRHAMMALGKVATEQLGKRYYCLAADFEFGRSVAGEAKRIFNLRGGTLIGEEYSPVGTEDFVPYLNKIDPKQVDILVAGFFGNDILKLVKQAHEKGMLNDMWIIGGTIPAGIGAKDFGPAGERIWFTGYFVNRMADIPENLKPFNTAYREAINMDGEGRYKESGEMGDSSYSWAAWEQVYWIKKGIEKTGWQNKEDNPKFIVGLEGMSVSAGNDFIQGAKTLRAQDHQVFTDQYVIKIEKGEYVCRAVVKAADLYYEPTADFTQEKL